MVELLSYLMRMESRQWYFESAALSIFQDSLYCIAIWLGLIKIIVFEMDWHFFVYTLPVKSNFMNISVIFNFIIIYAWFLQSTTCIFLSTKNKRFMHSNTAELYS